MRHFQNAFFAATVIGVAALAAPSANAQYALGYGATPDPYVYSSGPYAYSRGPYAYSSGPFAYASEPYGYYGSLRGSTYSYGADRANPSISWSGFDLDNPRDQQLQGHN
jgi:hypothetical protein